MDLTTLRRASATGALLVLSGLPLAAHADLAELSWTGRFGSGSLVYDRDVADSLAASGRGSFLDAIERFDFYALRLPWGSGGITLSGTGGSILSVDTSYPCGFNLTCDQSSVSFLLGRANAGDPLSYKMTMSLPFRLDAGDQLPLDASGDGWLPQEEDRRISAVVSNEFNSPSGAFIAMDGASVRHRLLPGVAPAVPEPETWALFGLGAALLGAARRRRSG